MTDGAQFIVALALVFITYELAVLALRRFFHWYFQQRGPDPND